MSQGLHQGVHVRALVDLGAERLNEPRASIAAPEGIVVPVGRLEDQKIREIRDFVGGG